MGLDFWEKGLFPNIDRYSIEYYGQEYKVPIPWMYQLLVSKVYQYTNMFYAKFIVIFFFQVLALSLLFYVLVKNEDKYSITNFIAASFLILPFLLRSFPRPELAVFIFILVEVLIIKRLEAKFNYRTLFYLFVIQTFWVFYHSSCILGYILLFGYFSAEIIKFSLLKNFKKAIEFSIWGLLFLSSVFFNYDIGHFIGAINFSDEWKGLITEHILPNLLGEEYYFFVWISLIGLYFTISKKELGSTITLIVFFLLTLESPRLLSYELFYITSIVSLSDHSVFKNLKNGLVVTLGVILYIFLVFFIYTRLETAPWKIVERSRLPIDLVEFLLKNKYAPGNILNDYSHGGYLMFKLPSDFRVMIDGRSNILYSAKDVRREREIKVDPRKFIQLDKELKFDYVITDITRPELAHELGLRTGLFSLEYLDSHHALLSKNKKRFPKLETLVLSPLCIENMEAEALKKELDTIESQEGYGIAGRNLLNMAYQYKLAKDKNEFLIRNSEAPFYTEYDLKLMAALNYLNGKWYKALMYMEGLVASSIIGIRDRLFILTILKNHNKLSDKKFIKQNLAHLYANRAFLTDNEFLILYDIVDHILQHEEYEGEKIITLEPLKPRYENIKKNPDIKVNYLGNCNNKSEVKVKKNED